MCVCVPHYKNTISDVIIWIFSIEDNVEHSQQNDFQSDSDEEGEKDGENIILNVENVQTRKLNCINFRLIKNTVKKQIAVAHKKWEKISCSYMYRHTHTNESNVWGKKPTKLADTIDNLRQYKHNTAIIITSVIRVALYVANLIIIEHSIVRSTK